MTRPTLLAAPGFPDDNDPRGTDTRARPVPVPVYRPAETVTPVALTTDETLAVWAALGDPAAFEELHRRWSRRIGAHLHRRAINPADLDDLVQEVFTTALELLHRGLLPTETFSAWLFGQAVARTLTGYFGKQWRHREAVGGATLTALTGGLGTAPAAGLAERIQVAMAELTPRRRQAIELRYLEGQSLAATALVLGIKVTSVEPLLGRARRDLHEALTGTERPKADVRPFEELMPAALEIAAAALAAGRPFGRRVLVAALADRGIPLGEKRAAALARMVRTAMPQIGTGRPTGLAHRHSDTRKGR
ncbi:RNA polymerase sigma factor [Candidatus Frankia nodulisporulans]|uniref:RNA polymerase sigma factor n=1 Tax=Candidatus Frankia nodulisporulans TaxID=2060052 RepID=UPI0013D35DEA|nr:sigma-70 family RNA polymerase sigma factor [Candidatus Frankia nodulisporulans]